MSTTPDPSNPHYKAWCAIVDAMNTAYGGPGRWGDTTKESALDFVLRFIRVHGPASKHRLNELVRKIAQAPMQTVLDDDLYKETLARMIAEKLER